MKYSYKSIPTLQGHRILIYIGAYPVAELSILSQMGTGSHECACLMIGALENYEASKQTLLGLGLRILRKIFRKTSS